MLGKIIKSVKDGLKLGNSPHNSNTMYPQNPYQDPYHNMGSLPVNDATYREMQQMHQFYQQQTEINRREYERQRCENAIVDNVRTQRTEYQSEMISSGADPAYYAKLNAAYQKGVNRYKK